MGAWAGRGRVRGVANLGEWPVPIWAKWGQKYKLLLARKKCIIYCNFIFYISAILIRTARPKENKNSQILK